MGKGNDESIWYLYQERKVFDKCFNSIKVVHLEGINCKCEMNIAVLIQ